MSDYNGYKNQATWTANVLLMETMEQMVSNGCDLDTIKSSLHELCNVDKMNLWGRNILMLLLIALTGTTFMSWQKRMWQNKTLLTFGSALVLQRFILK